MCGIAGISGKIITKHLDVLNDLGNMLCYRGEHATGIAFNSDMGLQIKKAPISPKKVDFVSALAFEEGLQEKIIFHNRFFTSGNPKENKNNHPFRGSTFALAHNGVLAGYKTVAMQNGIVLTDDEPETDSYILVRLIDKFLAEGLSFEEAIAKTCNLFLGSSLCLEILTDNNDLYLVRGDTYSFDLFEIGDNEYIYASSPTGRYNVNADESITNVIFNYLKKDFLDLFNENSDIEFRIKKISVPKYSIIKIDYDGKLQSITKYSEEKKYYDFGKSCGNYTNYSYQGYSYNTQKNLFGEDVSLKEALGSGHTFKDLDSDDEDVAEMGERDAYEEYVYEWCIENNLDYETFDYDDESQDLLPLSFEKWKEVREKSKKTDGNNETALKALEFIKKMYPKSDKKSLEKLNFRFDNFMCENGISSLEKRHPFSIYIERCLKELTGLKELVNLSDFLAEKFAGNYSKHEITNWHHLTLAKKLTDFTNDFWDKFEKNCK